MLLSINILGPKRAIINILRFKIVFEFYDNIVILAKFIIKDNARVYYIIRAKKT